MEDKELLQQLKQLQQVKAPESLHSAVQEQVSLLPAKHTGFYFPLIAFRMGFVLAVLLLIVLTTGGIVVAASHSNRGMPLYPVKVLIQRVAPAVIRQQDVKGAIAPTSTPTPIRQENNTPTPKSEHHGKEGNFTPTISPTKTQEKHGDSKHETNDESHQDSPIKKVEDTVNHTVENFFNKDN